MRRISSGVILDVTGGIDVVGGVELTVVGISVLSPLGLAYAATQSGSATSTMAHKIIPTTAPISRRCCAHCAALSCSVCFRTCELVEPSLWPDSVARGFDGLRVLEASRSVDAGSAAPQRPHRALRSESLAGRRFACPHAEHVTTFKSSCPERLIRCSIGEGLRKQR